MLWMLLGAFIAIGLLYGYDRWRNTRRGKKLASNASWWKRLAKLTRKRDRDD